MTLRHIIAAALVLACVPLIIFEMWWWLAGAVLAAVWLARK